MFSKVRRIKIIVWDKTILFYLLWFVNILNGNKPEFEDIFELLIQ